MNYKDLYNLHLVDVTQSHCGQRNQKNGKTKNQKGLQIKLRLESRRLEIQHNWAKLLVRDILPGDIIPYSEESEP